MPTVSSQRSASGGKKLVCRLLAVAIIGGALGLTLFFRLAYDFRYGPHRVEVSVEPDEQAGVRFNRFGPDHYLGFGDVAPTGPWDQDDDGFFQTESGGTLTFEGNTDSLFTVEVQGQPGTEAQLTLDDEQTIVIRPESVVEPAKHLLEFERQSNFRLWLLSAIFLIFGLFVAWFLLPAFARTARRIDKKTTLAAIPLAVFAGWFLLQILPIRAPPTTPFDVSISPIAADSDSAGPDDNFLPARVDLRDANNGALDLGRFKSAGDWAVDGEAWVNGSSDQPLRWRGLANDSTHLHISGSAEVSVNGNTVSVNGNTAEVSGDSSNSLASLGGDVGWKSTLITELSSFAEILVLSSFVFAVTGLSVFGLGRRRSGLRLALVNRSWPKIDVGNLGLRGRTSLYALPLLGVWLAVQLVFWPGLINPDAVAQISSVEAGAVTDWHPYLSSYFLSLLESAGGSIWLGVTLQFVVLAALCGRFLAWLDIRGARGPALIGLGLLAVNPVLAAGFVTLGKDQWFHLGVLGLVLAAWRIVDTRGDWLNQKSNLGWLLLAAETVLLARHNGWPMLAGTFILLLLFVGGVRLRVGAVAIVLIATVFVVQGPLFRALAIEPGPSEGFVWGFHVAAHVNGGTELTSAEEDFVANLTGVDPNGYYECTHGAPLVNFRASKAERQKLVNNISELRSLALRLAERNPRVTANHIKCSSAIYWRVTEPPPFNTYVTEWLQYGDFVRYLPPEGASGLAAEQPSSPKAGRLLLEYHNWLPTPLTRPALYLYALAFGATVASFRRRSWQPFILALPTIGGVISLIPVNLSPHPRLQLSTYVLGSILLCAFLVVKTRAPDDSDTRLSWREPKKQ